jgi:hypothetical protein
MILNIKFIFCITNFKKIMKFEESIVLC